MFECSHNDSARRAARAPGRLHLSSLAGHLAIALILILTGATAGAQTIDPVDDDNKRPRVIEDIPNQEAREDEPFRLDVSDNFEDPDGDPLTFTAENLPGSLSISEDGVISGTPTQDEIGRYRPRVIALDPSAEYAVERFRLEVVAVNDPPRIVRQNVDPLVTPEDEILRVTVGDFEIADPDTSLGGIRILLQPGANYTLIDDDELRPAANFNGNLTVPVIASDGIDESEPFLLKVRVTAVNDPPQPVGNLPPLVMDEDVPFQLNVSGSFTDPDGDAISFSAQGLPPALSISAAGLIQGTPRQADVGSYQATITARDAGGATGSRSLSVTVRNINDPPVISGQRDITTDEDTTRNITVGDLVIQDPDDPLQGLTLRLGNGANYSVSGTTIRPAANFSGSLTVPVTANDGKVDSNTFNLAVTVRSVNDRPVITGQVPTAVNEDNSVRFRLSLLTVTDPDNDYPDDFRFILQPGPNYSIQGDRIVPAANFNGELSVPVRVNDGRTDSLPFSFKIRVNPVNDRPVITGQRSVAVDEDGARTITTADFVINDPDDPVADLVLKLGPGENYSLNGKVLTPDPDFNGTLSVPATVSDDESESDVFPLSVTVRSINDIPVIDSQRPLTTPEDEPLTVTLADLSVTDPDHEYPADFTLSLRPGENYTLEGNQLTPAAEFSGNLVVPVTVNDGIDDSPVFVLSVDVGPVDDTPIILGQQPIAIDEDGSYTVTLEVLEIRDPDDPVETLKLKVANGENYSRTGRTVRPAEDFFGALSVPVTVSDESSTSEVFNLVIDVSAVNDAPVITGQLPLSTPEDTPFTIELGDLLVDDPDNIFPTDFALTVLPGENYTNTGTQIQPAANFDGALTVSVLVNDGDANSEPFPLVVLVDPINDVPVITGQQELATDEDVPFAITPSDLLIVDPDNAFPGDFAVQLTPGDNYTVNGNTVTPASNFFGRLRIPTRVSDGTAVSAPFVVRLEVRTVNDVPSLTAALEDQQAVEGEFFSYDISGNFDDADGDELTFELLGLPSDSSLTLDPQSGVLSGTPTFEDTRDFPFDVTVIARDEGGASGSGDFQLTIAALDRANVALALGVTPDPAMLEDQSRWTLTASNAGPSAATRLGVSGRITGSGLTVNAAAGANCVIDGSDVDVTAFDCDLGDIEADTQAVVALLVTIDSPGDIVMAAKARVAGQLPIDPNKDDNEARRTLSVARKLSNGAVQALGDGIARSVATADLDGDGDLDVVIGTGLDQAVEIYRGSGYRLLEEPADVLPETADTVAIATADLEGDGDIDLVFANALGQPDSVYLNSGNGRFELGSLLGDQDSRDVIAADFNGDGRLDLAFAATSGNTVYLDDGTGQYVPAETFGNAVSLGVDSADFNGDGWADLVFANAVGDSIVRLNDGGTGFLPAIRLDIDGATAVRALDLSGDGIADLVFARLPSTIEDMASNPVLANDGSGGFTPYAALGSAPSLDVAAGDVNADGRRDLLFVNATGTHQVYTGRDDGFRLAGEQLYEAGATAVVVADIGNDGGDDAVFAAFSQGSLYLNDNFGRLGLGDAEPPVIALVGEPVVDVPAGSPFADPGVVASDNIDGDISQSVQATSTVDSRIVGSYKVVYNVTDTAGNAADPVSRTVRVTPAEGGGGGGGGPIGPGGLLLLALIGMAVRRSARLARATH